METLPAGLGIWGLIGGGIPSIIMGFMWFLQYKSKLSNEIAGNSAMKEALEQYKTRLAQVEIERDEADQERRKQWKEFNQLESQVNRLNLLCEQQNTQIQNFSLQVSQLTEQNKTLTNEVTRLRESMER
jgi:septal ring factor EnvC (AmiA/AmiB activator)